jgi:hypothetical protein
MGDGLKHGLMRNMAKLKLYPDSRISTRIPIAKVEIQD